MVFAISLAAGLYATHVFVPPTPGPLAAAAALKADLGLVILFTFGGCYTSRPQPYIPWTLQYWDGDAWQTIIGGIGGGSGWDAYNNEPDATPWPYTPGVDVSALSIWMVPIAEAIITTEIWPAVWSDGNDFLWSYHIRCRGGACINNDESENPFKAVLAQYAEIVDPTTAIEMSDRINPADFALHQNYPNPFNPETTIKFDLQEQGHVALRVYDILGKQVSIFVNKQLSAGYLEIHFNAESLTSGIYFYQIQMGEYRETMKMLLCR